MVALGVHCALLMMLAPKAVISLQAAGRKRPRVEIPLADVPQSLEAIASELGKKMDARLSELSSDVAMLNEQVTRLSTFTRKEDSANGVLTAMKVGSGGYTVEWWETGPQWENKIDVHW
ncbi:hypothetical protein FOZ61_006462 [Perkinsus olseni]|nr:hypothetical protein FOZ61_006462 [Perkinsus olseni]